MRSAHGTGEGTVSLVTLRTSILFANSSNAFQYFVGTKASVFVIEAIARTVRRSNVKLHQVNVLADDVGWRADLKIVQLVITGHQIRVIEGDAVVGVSAEEERLRWSGAGPRGVYIVPKGANARLREVPSGLIQFHINLNVGRFVQARFAFGSALVVDARIGIRSTRLSRESVENEIRGRSLRREARMQTDLVIFHSLYFYRLSGLEKLDRGGGH